MTEATRQTRSDNTAVRTFQSGFPETELFDPMDRARHQELQGHEEAPGGFHQKLAESMGGRVREALYTVGEYNIVTVTEFPDDETVTAALLRVGSPRRPHRQAGRNPGSAAGPGRAAQGRAWSSTVTRVRPGW